MSDKNEPEAVKPPQREVPAEKEPRKALTPEQQLKRRKWIAIPIFFLIFAGAMYLIFALDSGNDGTDGSSSGYNVNVPDPNGPALVDSKKAAYEGSTTKAGGRMQTLDEFAAGIMGSKDNPVSGPRTEASPASEATDNINRSTQTFRQASEQMNDFYKPVQSREDTALTRQIEELKARVREAQQGQDKRTRQEELMERSYQMAARYLNPQGQSPAPQPAQDET